METMSNNRLRIGLYFETEKAFGGKLFRAVGSGLLSAYRNQQRILEKGGFEILDPWEKTDIDILQCNVPFPRTMRLIARMKKRGVPTLLWAHITAEDFANVFWFGKILFPLVRRALRWAYDQADHILCPTPYTKSLLVGYGIDAAKITPLSNGVDAGRFQKTVSAGARSKKTRETVLSVGLVIPRKGVDTFLRLAASHPQHDFLWVGKQYHRLLSHGYREVIPPNATLKGYVPDIVAEYHAADIFVFPSFEENQGMAILEAAAAGLPIIVRDLPVYRDWLIEGEHCLKAETEEDFSRLLDRLILDNDLRRKLSRGATALAAQHDIPMIIEELQRIYDRMLAAASSV